MACVGAACAAIVVATLVRFEGVKPTAYVDPVGIHTVCVGSTRDVVPGKTYTKEECDKRLDDDAADHAKGVKECITKPMTTGQQAAFTSFAFNVGVTRFCSSTLVQKFNAGDVAGACAELSRWTKAGGKTLPGLVKRRAHERALCEGRE